MKIPSLLLAACTLLSSTATAGDAIELVFNGQIDYIINHGSLPPPFSRLRLGDPYVVRFVIDSQLRYYEDYPFYHVHEASITLLNETNSGRFGSMFFSQSYGGYVIMGLQLDGYFKWDSTVYLIMSASIPGDVIDGVGDLDCHIVSELFRASTQTAGGIDRPDDELVRGPFTLTSCQILPCQSWHCPADFNCDGGVDGADVQAFFEKWESNNPEADLDGDGEVYYLDIEFFFLRWESNECWL